MIIWLWKRTKDLLVRLLYPLTKDLPANPHHRLLLGLDVHLDWDGCWCFLLKKCIVMSGIYFLVGPGADNFVSAWPCEQMLRVKYIHLQLLASFFLSCLSLSLLLSKNRSVSTSLLSSINKPWSLFQVSSLSTLAMPVQSSRIHQPFSFWRQVSQRVDIYIWP